MSVTADQTNYAAWTNIQAMRKDTIKKGYTNRKVECHLGIGLLNIGVEACLLIGLKPVSQSRSTDGVDQGGQAGEKSEPHCAWKRGY